MGLRKLIPLKNPTNSLHILMLPFSHCYSPTCFIPQRAILRQYWYISWAGSTQYMSRCKHLEVKIYLHVSYTDYI